MRQRDINRKAFSAVHYNIIAGRFKETLEPILEAEDYFRNEGIEKMLIKTRLQSQVVIDLAISMAKRFAMDNSEFDPVRFLTACSPDNEQYPLSELWPGVTEAEMVDG